MTEEKPTSLRAGNTVQTLTPISVSNYAQIEPVPEKPSDLGWSQSQQEGVWSGLPSVIGLNNAPKKIPPPEVGEPKFTGENLGTIGPGSIDGHNRTPDPDWFDEYRTENTDPTTLMGLLLDRIERLEDWRDHLDGPEGRLKKRFGNL